MKNSEIRFENHRAVMKFKTLSKKDFSKIRWKLIEQNIDEISLEFFKKLENQNLKTSRDTK